MASFVERVFTPVESEDWKVEKIIMHPAEFAELQEHARLDSLDLVTEPAVLRTGLRAHLFGTSVYADRSCRKGHYEVRYGNTCELKSVVCLSKDCPDLECIVDAVHDF